MVEAPVWSASFSRSASQADEFNYPLLRHRGGLFILSYLLYIVTIESLHFVLLNLHGTQMAPRSGTVPGLRKGED